MYSVNTRRQPADAPTEGEVMAVYADPNRGQGSALTVSDVAAHIYWMRGGTGNPGDAFTRDETPRVSSARLKPLLETLVARGTLALVSTTHNFEARGLISNKHPRRNATYYARVEDVRRELEQALRMEGRRELAQQVADQITRLCPNVVSANASKDGHVAVLLTRDVARRLFQLPEVTSS